MNEQVELTEVFRIMKVGDDEPIVRMLPDGSLVFGSNYDPDEAALIFWRSVEKHAKAAAFAANVRSA